MSQRLEKWRNLWTFTVYCSDSSKSCFFSTISCIHRFDLLWICAGFVVGRYFDLLVTTCCRFVVGLL